VTQVSLGPAGPIGWLVQEYRRRIGSSSLPDRAIDMAGEPIRQVVWDPLRPYVDQATAVFVVLDGVISALPLAALPMEDGTYLIEKYALNHLSHAADIVRVSEMDTLSSSGLLALGDVQYGVGQVIRSADVVASRAAPCVDAPFLGLPGTRDEVAFVAEHVGEQLKGEKVTVLARGEATEDIVQREAGRHRYLHLSTHGFFASGDCRRTLATKGPQLSFGTVEQLGDGEYEFDPMALSGLILAGANDRHDRNRKKTPHDGIWTAKEIASLDLGQTEFAVLSACETGLGELESGENVLGLQQAFQSAGVRTLIMSLWAVDDKATQELMEVFYVHRFSDNPLSEAAALRQAQLDMLQKNREAGRVRPGTWGAFFSAGDWR
jgi:CHAT domain-containing protein